MGANVYVSRVLRYVLVPAASPVSPTIPHACSVRITLIILGIDRMWVDLPAPIHILLVVWAIMGTLLPITRLVNSAVGAGRFFGGAVSTRG